MEFRDTQDRKRTSSVSLPDIYLDVDANSNQKWERESIFIHFCLSYYFCLIEFWNCSVAFCYLLELFCGILLFFGTILWHFVIFWKCSVAFCYFMELFCGILLSFRTSLWHYVIFWNCSVLFCYFSCYMYIVLLTVIVYHILVIKSVLISKFYALEKKSKHKVYALKLMAW